MSVRERPAIAPRQDRRNNQRVETQRVVVLLRPAGAPESAALPARVLDVSLSGMRLIADAAPQLGAKLTVAHPTAGELSCTCLRLEPDGTAAVVFDPAEREVERVLQCLALLLSPDP